MAQQEEQFTMIPKSLMGNKDLTDQDKLTLGVILSFIKNGKECYIGNDTLGDMLGISKNAASSRILRLQKIGCISLRYTYKDGKKEVDKRYITLLSLTPEVSSDRQEVSSRRRRVSSDRQRGIVSQTKGSRPTDEGVSSKLGGIIQPDYTSVLDNLKEKVLHTLPHKELDKENPVELNDYEKEQLLNLIKTINAPDDTSYWVECLIKNEDIVNSRKEQIRKHKHFFNRGTLLPKVIEQRLAH